MTPDDTKPAGAGTDDAANPTDDAVSDPGEAVESPEDGANDEVGATAGSKQDSAWGKAGEAGEDPDGTAALKARLLHALADMENLRKRTERELADTRRYAVSSFAREVLTVRDNLQRALDAVPDELRAGDNKAATALVEGVEVTARTLEQTLEKFGVARIETEGAKFDPSVHQAMMEVDDPDAEPGTVATEIQSGYAIGDRVLRPAFVSVVKKRKVNVEVKGDPGSAAKPANGDDGDAANASAEAGQG